LPKTSQRRDNPKNLEPRDNFQNIRRSENLTVKAERAEHLRIEIFVESLEIVAQMLCPYGSFTIVFLFSNYLFKGESNDY
jgi:hypothetical protein